jgi:hypothetical protein
VEADMLAKLASRAVGHVEQACTLNMQNVKKNTKYKLIKAINIALTWNTILPDQINNLLQHQVSLRHCESDRERLSNKTLDISVNPIPVARVDMPIDGRLNVVAGHIARGCPKYTIQDDGEVNDVAHHTSNIFLAGMREELR